MAVQLPLSWPELWLLCGHLCPGWNWLCGHHNSLSGHPGQARTSVAIHVLLGVAVWPSFSSTEGGHKATFF